MDHSALSNSAHFLVPSIRKKGWDKGYLTGRNFGSINIEIDWGDSTENHDMPSMKVNVHDHLDHLGNLVLTANWLLMNTFLVTCLIQRLKVVYNQIVLMAIRLVPFSRKLLVLFHGIVLISFLYRMCCRTKNYTSIHVKKKIRSDMI